MPISSEADGAHFPAGGIAVVVGASGAIGSALHQALAASSLFTEVIGFSRTSLPGMDVKREDDIISCAQYVQRKVLDVRLAINATGFLHGPDYQPEKSLRDIAPDPMAHAFAVNAIAPALLMKHFMPLMPRRGKAVFANLSARVGSIGDNHLGGWYSYRASKAALNQLVKTAAIELARRKPDAICVAIHPGTVESPLSDPFHKTGLKIRSAQEAAVDILQLIQSLTPAHNGIFLDYRGTELPW